jgi:hypothetical protein
MTKKQALRETRMANTYDRGDWRRLSKRQRRRRKVRTRLAKDARRRRPRGRGH